MIMVCDVNMFCMDGIVMIMVFCVEGNEMLVLMLMIEGEFELIVKVKKVGVRVWIIKLFDECLFVKVIKGLIE